MTKRIAISVVLCAAALFQTTSAKASTEIAVTLSFAGFTLVARTGIGRGEDPDAAAHFEREARQRIKALAPTFKKMLAHYKRGKHPFKGLSRYLTNARKNPEKNWTISIGLQPIGQYFGGGAYFPDYLILHSKRLKNDKVRRLVQRRIVQGFILAQLFPRGEFASKPAAQRGADHNVYFFLGLNSLERVSFAALNMVLRYKKQILQVAAGKLAVPPPKRVPALVEYTNAQGKRVRTWTSLSDTEKPSSKYWKDAKVLKRNEAYRANTHLRQQLVPRLWGAFLKNAPFADKDYAALVKLPARVAETVVSLMAALTPPTRWKVFCAKMGAALAQRKDQGKKLLPKLLALESIVFSKRRGRKRAAMNP